jgi:hypothetical protein
MGFFAALPHPRLALFLQRNAVLLLNTGEMIRQRHARFAHTPVTVIIKLIKCIPVHPLLAFTIQIGAEVFECVEVLRHTLHKLPEARI